MAADVCLAPALSPSPGPRRGAGGPESRGGKKSSVLGFTSPDTPGARGRPLGGVGSTQPRDDQPLGAPADPVCPSTLTPSLPREPPWPGRASPLARSTSPSSGPSARPWTHLAGCPQEAPAPAPGNLTFSSIKWGLEAPRGVGSYRLTSQTPAAGGAAQLCAQRRGRLSGAPLAGAQHPTPREPSSRTRSRARLAPPPPQPPPPEDELFSVGCQARPPQVLATLR